MSVCNRKPALEGLEGLWTCTESIVGCACGAAVSIEWSEAVLYWNAGCKAPESGRGER